MIILDKLLTGGIKFVLGKVASAVDQERDDDESLREQLLHAQMQHELGAMSAEELGEVEREILARLREIRERRKEGGGLQLGDDDVKVTGIEADFTADEPFDSAPPVPAALRSGPSAAAEIVTRNQEVTIARKKRRGSRIKGRR